MVLYAVVRISPKVSIHSLHDDWSEANERVERCNRIYGPEGYFTKRHLQEPETYELQIAVKL